MESTASIAPQEAQQEAVLPAYKVSITTDGLSILIANGLVQEAFQNYMTAILADKSQYNNPVKKLIETIFSGYNAPEGSKEVKAEFDKLVFNQMKTYMTTPSFHLQLGQAMAEEMAKRAVDKLTPSK